MSSFSRVFVVLKERNIQSSWRTGIIATREPDCNAADAHGRVHGFPRLTTATDPEILRRLNFQIILEWLPPPLRKPPRTFPHSSLRKCSSRNTSPSTDRCPRTLPRK